MVCGGLLLGEAPLYRPANIRIRRQIVNNGLPGRSKNVK
jgi:hypothetical protein